MSHGGTENYLSKHADDLKLGGMADMPDGGAAMKSDLNRLEKWADRNLTKFNKGNWGPTSGEKQPHESVYTDEKATWQKRTWASWQTLLNKNQQHDLTAKKGNGIHGYIRRSFASRSREVILLFCSALPRPHLEWWVQFWALQYKGDVNILEGVRKRPLRWLRVWSISPLRKGWESRGCLA